MNGTVPRNGSGRGGFDKRNPKIFSASAEDGEKQGKRNVPAKGLQVQVL